MKRPLLEVLKDWSSLVVGGAALLYVLGFTVHWAYFRLLGIEINGQPLDYLRFAADYVISIVGSFPQLVFAFVYYSPKLVQAPLVTSTIAASLTVILSLALYVRRKSPKRAPKDKPAVFMIGWWSLNVTIIISFALLLQTEFDIVKVRNVLQPGDAAEIQQMQNQIATAGDLDAAALFDVRSKNVGRIYEKYTLTQKGSPGFHQFNEWFNPWVEPTTGTERRAMYLALLLLNLALFSAIIIQLLSLKLASLLHQVVSFRERIGPHWSQMVVIILSAGLVVQIFLFPFVYATLGRNLTYPVVMLRISSPSAVPIGGPNEVTTSNPATPNYANTAISRRADDWTHCVYLIADLDNEIIVYDRLNFFQVKRIPRTRILTVSQLFAASPFESCSKDVDTFTPCETLWMSEQTPILDF